MSKTKRIQVTFTENEWVLLEKLRGEFGEEDADIIRNIVFAWLSNKNLFSQRLQKMRLNQDKLDAKAVSIERH